MVLGNKGPPRLTLDQLIAVKLFEIADRLEGMTPVGYLRSQQIIITNQTLTLASIQTFSCINDGPDDVYIWANEDATRVPWEAGDAPLKINERLEPAFKYTVGNIVYLRCKPGQTASVRYWKLV